MLRKLQILLQQLKSVAAFFLIAVLMLLPALTNAWTVEYVLTSPDGASAAEALEPGETFTLNVDLNITLETDDTAFATSAATVVIDLNSGHNLTLSATQPTSVASASLSGDVLTLSFTENTTPEDTAGLNNTSLSCGSDPVTTPCSESLRLASVEFTVGEVAIINRDETKDFSIDTAMTRLESLTVSSSMPTTQIAADQIAPSSQNTDDTATVYVRRDITLMIVTLPTVSTPIYDGRNIVLRDLRIEARDHDNTPYTAFNQNVQISISCPNCVAVRFVSSNPIAFSNGVYNGSLNFELTLLAGQTTGSFNVELETANTEAVTLLENDLDLISSEPIQIRPASTPVENGRIDIQTAMTFTISAELLRVDNTVAIDPQRTTIDSLTVDFICDDCISTRTAIVTADAYADGIISNFAVEVYADYLRNNLRQTDFSLNLLVNMSGGLVSQLITGIATGTVNGDIVEPRAATLTVTVSTINLTASFSFGATTDQLFPGGMELPLSSDNGGQFMLFYQRIGERNSGLSCPADTASIIAGGSSLTLTSVAEDGSGSPRMLSALTPNSFYCTVLQVTDPVGLTDLSNVVGFDSAIRATQLTLISPPVSSVPSSVGRGSSQALISHRGTELSGFVVHAVNDTGEIQPNFNVTGNLTLPYDCSRCSNNSSLAGSILSFESGILSNRSFTLSPELDDLAITDSTYSLELMVDGHFGTLSLMLLDAAPVIGDITPPEVAQDLSATAGASSVMLNFGDTTDRQIPSDSPVVLTHSNGGSFTIYYMLAGERTRTSPNPACSMTSRQLRTVGTAVAVTQINPGGTAISIDHSVATPLQPNRNYCAILAVVDPGDFEQFSNLIGFNTEVRATRLVIENTPAVRNIVSGRQNTVGTFVVRGQNNADENDTVLSAMVTVSAACSNCVSSPAVTITPASFTAGLLSNANLELSAELLDLAVSGQYTVRLEVPGFFDTLEIELLTDEELTGDTEAAVPPLDLSAVAAATSVTLNFGDTTDRQIASDSPVVLTPANGGSFTIYYMLAGERTRATPSPACSVTSMQLRTAGTGVAVSQIASGGSSIDINHSAATPIQPNRNYCALLAVVDPGDFERFSNLITFNTEVRATRLVIEESPAVRNIVSGRSSTVGAFIIRGQNNADENDTVLSDMVTVSITCTNCAGSPAVTITPASFTAGLLDNANLELSTALLDLAVFGQYSVRLEVPGFFGTLELELLTDEELTGDTEAAVPPLDLSAVAEATLVTLSFGDTTDRQIASDSPVVLTHTNGGSFTIYYRLAGERTRATPDPRCTLTPMQLRTAGTAVTVSQVASGGSSIDINHSAATPIQPNRNYCAVLAVIDPGDFERFSNLIHFNTEVRATRLVIEAMPAVRNIVSGRLNTVGAFAIRGQNNAAEDDTVLSGMVTVSAACSNCVSSPVVTITPVRFSGGLLSNANLGLRAELLDLTIFGQYSVGLETQGFFGTLELELLTAEELTGDTEPAMPPRDLRTVTEGSYRVRVIFGGTTDMRVSSDAPSPLTSEHDAEFRLFYLPASRCPAAASIDSGGYSIPLSTVAADGAAINLLHSAANTPLQANTAYCIVLRVIDPGDFVAYSNIVAFTTAEYSPADNNGNGIPDHLDQTNAGLTSTTQYFTDVLNCPADALGICDSNSNGVPDPVEVYYGRPGDVAFSTSRTVWTCQAEGTYSRISAARQTLNCGGVELADLSSLLLHTAHLNLASGGITSPTMLGSRQLPSGTYWLSNRENNRVNVTRLDLYPQAKLSIGRLSASAAIHQISSLGPAPIGARQIFTGQADNTLLTLTATANEANARLLRAVEGLAFPTTAVLTWTNPAGSVRRGGAFTPAYYGVHLELQSGQSIVSAGSTVSIRVTQNHSSLRSDSPLLVNDNRCASLQNRPTQVVDCPLPGDLAAGDVAVFSVSIETTDTDSVAVFGATSALVGNAGQSTLTDTDGNRLPDEIDGIEVGNSEVLRFALGQGMARTTGYLRVNPGVRVRAGTTALANYLAGAAVNLSDTDYGINVAGLRDNPANMLQPLRSGSLDLNFEFRCHRDDPHCLTETPTIVLYAPESASGFSFRLTSDDGVDTPGISCQLPLPSPPPTGCDLEGVRISFAATVTENICPAFDNEEAWAETAIAPTGGNQLPCIRLTAPVDPVTGFYTSVAGAGVLGGGVDPFAGSSGGGGAIDFWTILVLSLLMLLGLATGALFPPLPLSRSTEQRQPGGSDCRK